MWSLRWGKPEKMQGQCGDLTSGELFPSGLHCGCVNSKKETWRRALSQVRNRKLSQRTRISKNADYRNTPQVIYSVAMLCSRER